MTNWILVLATAGKMLFIWSPALITWAGVCYLINRRSQ